MQIAEPTKKAMGGVCDMQTMDAPAFERAIITNARAFPHAKANFA